MLNIGVQLLGTLLEKNILFYLVKPCVYKEILTELFKGVWLVRFETDRLFVLYFRRVRRCHSLKTDQTVRRRINTKRTAGTNGDAITATKNQQKIAFLWRTGLYSRMGGVKRPPYKLTTKLLINLAMCGSRSHRDSQHISSQLHDLIKRKENLQTDWK